MEIAGLQKALIARVKVMEKFHKFLFIKSPFLPQVFFEIASIAILGDNVAIIDRFIRVDVFEQVGMIYFFYAF